MKRGASLPVALPALTAPPTANGPRGVSPNVAKRAAWSTPRTPAALASLDEQNEPVASTEVGDSPSSDAEDEQGTPVTPPLLDALEVLHAVLVESENQSDSARQREKALEETRKFQVAEERELERTRLAADEQLNTTVELLQAELAEARRLRTRGSTHSMRAVAPPVIKKSPSKRQAARLAPRLRDSPLKPRMKERASVQRPERERAEERGHLGLFEHEVEMDNMQLSVREVKLHDLREECTRWQRDYETMREQVIKEKARQVTLFQRLEVVRRSHATQLHEADAALRASQADAERLQARLAQARVRAAHEARRTASIIQSSQSERQRLVCALAETRHKFREWKEGEAATLRATREQAVHALRTEYELKLARHQEEKQKLRDKVKDLEVSLRLLQRDRQLSPGELSERKGTMLLHSLSGSVSVGEYGAADLIEAQGRIHELEALLALSKVRQERQDTILHDAETALARFSQERELDALEGLALPSAAVSMVMTSLTPELQVEVVGKAIVPAAVPASLPSSNPFPTEAVVVPVNEPRMEREGSISSTPTRPVPPSTPSRSSPKRPSITGLIGAVPDVEKEILRRKSIALSAEVNRYQKIVVQSMEEVRALKESRRRSRSGSVSTSSMVLSARESYLLEELAAAQHEIEAFKKRLKKIRKNKSKKQMIVDDEGIDKNGNTDIESSSSSDSTGDSDSDSDSEGENNDNESPTTTEVVTPVIAGGSHNRLSFVNEFGHDEDETEHKEAPKTEAAVVLIQTCSKGFLARREFIRKKLAIGKIKAQYRGYLVRKNYEVLGSSCIPTDRRLLPSGLAPLEAPNLLLVTEAVQYKMQIVEPHHTMSCHCEGRGKGKTGNVNVVLRVSKDPPIMHIQITPSTDPDQVPHAAYFHLFETIALLPYEDEEIVLESSSEKEIAGILASRLAVQQKVSDSEYHFFITRPGNNGDGQNGEEESAVNRGSRTLLSELPVQVIETRAISAASDTFESSLDGTAPPEKEVDLDLLIREARTDPLDDEANAVNASEKTAEDPTVRIRRLVRRLSSTTFGDLPQS